MVSCPKCKTPNADGSVFCKACRTALLKSDAKLRCSNGHIVDTSWGGSCPQCQSEGKDSQAKSGRKATMSEGVSGRFPTDVEAQKAMSERQGGKAEVRRQTAPMAEKEKRTVIDTGDSVNPEPDGGKGRLVGFLATYSADPLGKAFELREGKHLIGRGSGVDICIPGDDLLSSHHATILYRRGKFIFDDNLSTNGSLVNGKEVDEKVELGNYDEIKIGNTLLRLIKIEKETPPSQ